MKGITFKSEIFDAKNEKCAVVSTIISL